MPKKRQIRTATRKELADAVGAKYRAASGSAMALRPWLLCAAIACCNPASAFDLRSPTIPPGATFPYAQRFEGFGCRGGNRSPALAWKDTPQGTRSFALTLYDPDAPTGAGWWHWVLVDLPATTRGLPAGAGDPAGTALPAGARQLRNDFGSLGYGGPCPPAGSPPHHYVFTVYALKVDQLSLPADASPELAGFMIHADALGSATMTVRYGR